MTIAQAFDEITVQHGGTASKSGSIASAIDALNDALAGSDQQAAQDIEGAVRLLGQHIGGGSASGTISITENGEYDVSAYATADVEVSGGSLDIGNPVLVMYSDTAPVVGNVDLSGGFGNLPGEVLDIAIGNVSVLTPDAEYYLQYASGLTFLIAAAGGLVSAYDCTVDENYQYASVEQVTGIVTGNDNDTAYVEVPNLENGHFLVLVYTTK